jgi:hypothetical protein
MVLFFRLFHQLLYVVEYWDRDRRRFDDEGFTRVQGVRFPVSLRQYRFTGERNY